MQTGYVLVSGLFLGCALYSWVRLRHLGRFKVSSRLWTSSGLGWLAAAALCGVMAVTGERGPLLGTFLTIYTLSAISLVVAAAFYLWYDGNSTAT